MRRQIQEEQDEFKAKHVFPIPRRSYSSINLHSRYTEYKILKEPDSSDAFVMYMHPTNRYQKFVKDQASNNFSAMRDLANGNEEKFKYLRKQKCKIAKKRMRIRS